MDQAEIATENIVSMKSRRRVCHMAMIIYPGQIKLNELVESHKQ
jgi:hypothetical protein